MLSSAKTQCKLCIYLLVSHVFLPGNAQLSDGRDRDMGFKPDDLADEVTVFGVKVPNCPHTCRQQCDSVNQAVNTGSCYCDKACEAYGDCCLDYFDHCLNAPGGHGGQSTETEQPNEVSGDGDITDADPTESSSFQEAIERKLRSAASMNPAWFQNTNQECISVNAGARSLLLMVVTKCPANVPSELASHVPLCELHSGFNRTIQEHTMVFKWGQYGTSRGKLYSNVHCALCHRVELAENATLISPEFLCYDDAEAEAEGILQSGRYDDLWSFLTAKCNATYDVMSFEIERLRCPKFADYQHTCPKSKFSDEKFTVALCNAYIHTVYDSKTCVYYKNSHCASCTNLVNGSELECFVFGGLGDKDPSTPDIDLPSFSLLFDFSGKPRHVIYNERTFCPSDTFHNLADDTCVKNTCGNGYVLLEGSCRKLNVAMPHLMNETSFRSVFILVGHIPQLITGILPFPLFLKRWEGQRITISKVDHKCSVISSSESIWSEVLDSTLNTEDCYIIEVDGLETVSLWKFVEDLDNAATNSLSFEGGILYFNHWPYYQDWDCSGDGSKEVTPVGLIERNGLVTSNLAFLYNNTGINIPFDKTPAMMYWPSDSVNKYPSEVVAVVCAPEIVSCWKIVVQATHYTFVRDSVKVRDYSHTLIPPHLYAMLEDDQSIVVCSEALPNVTVVVEDSSRVEGILSLIGISLSLLGLAFTLLTYSLFPRLRNVPGVGIMNLCVALFVAQLLFEVAPLVSGHDAICTGLAALGHYSWFVAFLWMNVLAYDISCTFANMTAQSYNETIGSLRFRVFCLYAWGSPCLPVASSLVLSMVADVGFEYIDLDICWIKGGFPLVYSFGIPLALIILLNVVFFIRTAVALRAAMKIAQRAKSDGDSSARYAVYIKLSSLMGFTWIFGFVAGLAEVDYLSYLFIVTNSLQGVYICFSFALSDRVLKMYKEKFGSEGNKSITSGTTGNDRLSKSAG